MFKKIIALTICTVFSFNLAFAAETAAQDVVYDFSDEAQAEFNKTNDFKPIQAQIIGLPSSQTIWQPQTTENMPTIQNTTELIKVLDTVNSDKGKILEPPVTLTSKENKKVFDARLVYISKGTPIDARLNSTIDSGSVQNNSAVTAELTNDWIVDGTLIAPEGSIVSGSFVDTTQAGWAMKNGQIGLSFDKILTPSGTVIPLSANKVYVTVEGSRVRGMAKNMAVGAILGTVFGLLTMDTSMMLNGAIAGTAGGAIAGIATKGEDATLPAGTTLQLRLSREMTAEPYDI